MKIVEYYCAKGDDRYEINENVKKLMSEGRQPFGSVSCSCGEQFIYLYAQAMVKYEEAKTEDKKNSIIEMLYHQRGVLIDGFHKIESKTVLEECIYAIAKIDDKINEYEKGKFISG